MSSELSWSLLHGLQTVLLSVRAQLQPHHSLGHLDEKMEGAFSVPLSIDQGVICQLSMQVKCGRARSHQCRELLESILPWQLCQQPSLLTHLPQPASGFLLRESVWEGSIIAVLSNCKFNFLKRHQKQKLCDDGALPLWKFPKVYGTLDTEESLRGP